MSTIHDALQHAVFGQNWPHYDAMIEKRVTARIAGNQREERRLTHAMRRISRDTMQTTRTLDGLEHLAGMCPPVGCHYHEREAKNGR